MLSLHMLKTARRFYGLTQEELAKKIGKTQQYYVQIEKGTSISAPVIKKLSNILNMRESYLWSKGEYIEYPFLADFYQFCIAEKDAHELYRFIRDDICSKSAFVDVLFLVASPRLIGLTPRLGGNPVMYVAIRDDRDTIFLFKRRVKTRGYALATSESKNDIAADSHSLDASQKLSGKLLEIKTFAGLDYFREIMQDMRGPYVFETTVRVSEDLYHRIEEGTVTREEIAGIYPNVGYFEGMYQAHNRIKKR